MQNHHLLESASQLLGIVSDINFYAITIGHLVYRFADSSKQEKPKYSQNNKNIASFGHTAIGVDDNRHHSPFV